MAGKPIKITLLADNSNALRGINAVASRLGVLSRISQAAGRALARTARVGFLATAAGAAFLVKKVYDVNTALERSGVAFRHLFKEAGGAATALASVRDIASNSPFPVDQLAIYTKQLAGAGNTAAEADKKLRIILDTTAAFGSTQEQTGRAILALTQIQSKATVQAEELNQLAEAGIPAYIALAKATGKSVPELRKLGQEGKLLSKDVLPVLYAQLQKDYAGALVEQANTLSGRLNTLKNRSLFLLSDAMKPLFDYLSSKLPGVTDAFTRLIPRLGEGFAKLPALIDRTTASVRNWAVEFDAALTRVTGTGFLGNLERVLKGGKAVFQVSFKFFGNDLIQNVVAGLALMVLQWKALNAAIRTATAAQVAFNAVAGKGPLVGITAIIAGATLGFIHFRNAGYDVATSLKLIGTTAAEWSARFGAALLGALEFVGIFIGNLTAGGIRAAIEQGLIQPLRDAAVKFANLFDKLPSSIKPQGLINALRGFGNEAGFTFGDALSDATQRGTAAFNKRVNSIAPDTNKALLGLPSVAQKAGAATGRSLLLGFTQEAPASIRAAQNVSRAVGQNLAATQDPAHRAGERSSSAFTSGLNGGKSAAAAAGRAVGSGAVAGATAGTAPMTGTGGEAGNKFASGIRTRYGFAQSAGTGLARAAAAGAQIATSVFSNIGSNLGHALASGLRATQSAVSSAASTIIGIANRAARAAAEIRSPSKLFEEIGRFMVLGLIDGLTKDRESLRSTAVQLANLVSGTAKAVAEERASLFGTAQERRKDLAQAQRELSLAVNTKAKTKQEAEQRARDIKEAQRKVEAASKAYLAAVAKVAQFDKDAAVKAISNPKTRAATQNLIVEFARSMDAILAQREDITARLEEANDKLADALRTRDDFADKLREGAKSFASLSSLTFEDEEGARVAPSSDAIRQQLQERLDAIRNFSTQVEQLAARGLNRDLLQQILEMGPETGTAFAKAILDGGAAGIQSLNGLQTQINGASDRLAKFGSEHLFQAGVDSAQALVDGLKAKQAELEKAANAMAKAFAEEFQRILNITLPSLLPVEELFRTQTQATAANTTPVGTAGARPAQTLTVQVRGDNPHDVEVARRTIAQLQAYTQLNGPIRLQVVS